MNALYEILACLPSAVDHSLTLTIHTFFTKNRRNYNIQHACKHTR